MEGYMKDSKGRLVPIEQVKEIDQLRNDLVIELVEAAKQQSDTLRESRLQAMRDVDAFVSLSADKYDIKYGGQKGNITLTSYDGRYRVVKAIRDQVSFDERILIAKEMIDGCIKKWSSGSRSEIRALVSDAFQVDRTGRLNIGRILHLRQLDIIDPDWRKAMDAISDSVQFLDSKSYIRFYERTEHGGYIQIAMDLASA